MGIFNQLLVRFPKWIVSWVLVIMDAAIGFYVLNRIAIDPSVQFINYSFFTIFIILQIFWCAVFWAANLYNGDAEVSRFGETETLIKSDELIDKVEDKVVAEIKTVVKEKSEVS